MKLLFLFFLVLPMAVHSKVVGSSGAYSNKIVLNWTRVTNAVSYAIERIYDAPKLTSQGKDIPFEPIMLTQIKTTNYTDIASPAGRQKYIVTALDKDGIAIGADEGLGWRTVNDQEFFLEFQKSIDSSLPRIRTMKRLNFKGEKVEGWRGGSLVYKTTGIVRRPMRVTITYTNFVDQYLELSGVYEVQIFKLFRQRGKLVGTFNVDGIYKGTVTHDLVLDKGQSTNGGVYRVQQEGKPEAILPWNVTTHPLDDAAYEENLKGSLKGADKED